ncbi:MAG TPA: mechanosensitive ion channel domain-containing protein [Gillisia sp.]|nr:mechanosensitive ion channel domain-containing protein [Gillisia sp.]
MDPGLQNTQEGDNIALILQELLDQGYLIPYARISNERGTVETDVLSTNRERVGTVTVEGEKVPVLVESIVTEEGTPIWVFSAETVELIAGATTSEPVIIEQVLPNFLTDNLLWGAPIGQWLALIVLAVFAYMFTWSLLWVIHYIIPKIWPKAGKDPIAGIIYALNLPILLFFAGWIFIFLSQQVGISIILRQRFNVLSAILAIVAIVVLLWRLVKFIGEFSKKQMIKQGNVSGLSIVSFVQRALSITIVIIGVIAFLGLLGINVTAGLAALGIGGLALALGAQKTLENLVGSITLVADQPVRVGDFCKIGDIVGTVERIGMRSTRLRTLGRTIVTIPNGEFASQKIENFAHRDRFWFNPVLNLRYETTPDQIRYLLVELRSILYAHPKVSPQPARIRFTSLGATSLDFEVFAYVNAIDFDEFLEVQEDLLLRMMDVVEESGSGFAFPSQTIYFSKDSGVSEEKTKAAHDTVKKWKEEKDLQIPKFDQNKIHNLKDTIAYPPEGSANIKNNGFN